MIAVVEIQGKQYIITDTTSTIETDSFRGVKVGDTVVVDKVLLYQEKEGGETLFGTPYLEGQKFELEIVSQEKQDKVYGIKFRRRHRYLRRVNHRQIKATLGMKGAVVKKVVAKKTEVSKPKAKAEAVKKVPAKSAPKVKTAVKPKKAPAKKK